jgi:nitroreductase
MDLLDGLQTRRSVYFFTQAMPDPAALREALDAAVRAPNHHQTCPWRFAVFAGAGRERLARRFVAAAERLGRPLERARDKAFESPVLVLAGATPRSPRPNIVLEEESLAVGAGIQNLMLALHARGIGSLWTSGPVVEAPEVRELVGWTQPNDRVVGLVYVGHADPARPLPPRPERSHRDLTAWYEEA